MKSIPASGSSGVRHIRPSSWRSGVWASWTRTRVLRPASVRTTVPVRYANSGTEHGPRAGAGPAAASAPAIATIVTQTGARIVSLRLVYHCPEPGENHRHRRVRVRIRDVQVRKVGEDLHGHAVARGRDVPQVEVGRPRRADEPVSGAED